MDLFKKERIGRCERCSKILPIQNLRGLIDLCSSCKELFNLERTQIQVTEDLCPRCRMLFDLEERLR